MQLADWLKETNTKQFRFAERIGVQPSVLSDYLKGKYRPKPVTADAIVRETGGAVTHKDLYSTDGEATGAAQ